MSGVNCPGVKSTPPCRILLIRGIRKLYLYGSSNYNNLNFKAVECRSKLCCIANSKTANFTKVHVRICHFQKLVSISALQDFIDNFDAFSYIAQADASQSESTCSKNKNV